MHRANSFRRVAVTAIGVLLAACDDRSGPGPTPAERFDAAALQASVAAMERLTAIPVVASYQALGPYLGSVRVTGLPAAASTAAGPEGLDLLALASRIAGWATPRSGPQLVPIIRSEVLGRTFVYDPATRQYVADPARPGAPANGVRFILYEVDEETKAPKAGAEIGWADLIDEKAASASALGLRLRVVSNGITHLDYGFELSGQFVSPTLTVNGFLSDGTERLNFDLTASGQLLGDGGAVRLEGRLEMPSRRFTVTASMQVAAGEALVDLSVRGGDDVIVVRSRVRETQLDAAFTVNGRLLATATGDPHNPVIRGEGGRDLTPEEGAALAQIAGLADAIFRLFGKLLKPVGGLLGIGVGL